MAGIAIAGYLTIAHFRESLLVCTGVSDCEAVQNSSFAEVGGIPVALMGLLTFLALTGLAFIRVARAEYAEILTLITFALVAAAVGFYIYLSYIELVVIDAICQWCVASSLITFGLFITESILLRRVLATTNA